MTHSKLSVTRVRQILDSACRTRILVIGDAMLDHFIQGTVARISPEAPVPVLDFESESFMPGGAASVARNLTALHAPAELLGTVGRDVAAGQLRRLLGEHHIGCVGLLTDPARATSVKTRIVAQMQQVVRIDRESRDGLSDSLTGRLVGLVQERIRRTAAVII